jgi:hypothetical protein
MKDWINAAQLYRHGQEPQEPAEPPMDFVIAHLSAAHDRRPWWRGTLMEVGRDNTPALMAPAGVPDTSMAVP